VGGSPVGGSAWTLPLGRGPPAWVSSLVHGISWGVRHLVCPARRRSEQNGQASHTGAPRRPMGLGSAAHWALVWTPTLKVEGLVILFDKRNR